MPRAPRPSPEPAPDGPPKTPYQRARARALALARAQASDADIAAVLRSELATTKPKAVMIATEIERRVQQWAREGLLEDARTAGRLAPLECLLEAAEGGDTGAAAQLARRDEKDPGAEFKRQMQALASMAPAERAAFAEQLLVRLGAA